MRALQTLMAVVVLTTFSGKHVNGASLSGTTSRYTSEEIQRNRNSIPPEVAKIVSSLVSLLPDDVEEQLRKGGFNVYVEKSNASSGPEVYFDTAKNGKDLIYKKTQEGMQNFGNSGQRIPSLQAENMAFNIGPIPPPPGPKRKNYWVEPEPLVRMPVPLPPSLSSPKQNQKDFNGGSRTNGTVGKSNVAQAVVTKAPQSVAPNSAKTTTAEKEMSMEVNYLQMRFHDRSSMTATTDEDKSTTTISTTTTGRPPVLDKPPKFIRIGDAVDNAIPFPHDDAASLLRRAIKKLKDLGPSPLPVLPKQTKKPTIATDNLPPLLLTPHGITAMGIPYEIVGGKLRKREAVI